MAELHDLTAVEQARAVRRRTVSPVELVEHHLARIEAIDGTLGAFVTVTADAALDAARAAEKLVTDTASSRELPPLLGVPTAIKDLNMTAGVRTTFGSTLYGDFVPPVDDDEILMDFTGTDLQVAAGVGRDPEFAQLAARFEQNLRAFLDLVEAATHYPCMKKAWVEFLGEPGGDQVGRVQAA